MDTASVGADAVSSTDTCAVAAKGNAEETTVAQGSSSFPTTVCPYFAEGRCRFGDACRKRHIASSTAADVDDMQDVRGADAVEVAAVQAAADTTRERELSITLFGAARRLGVFPTKLHSDLRHLVEMLRRAKKPRISEDRVSALEAALSAPGADVAVRSIAELRGQVEEWRVEGRKSWDAERYYDKARAAGYTEHNRGPQEALAHRALQLCSVTRPTLSQSKVDANDAVHQKVGGMSSDVEALLAVDLGCGTGLSTMAAERLAGYRMGVIGLDLSSEMLRADAWKEATLLRNPLGGERVRGDLAQPLPFRSGVFDVAYSVAAVHYLAQDATQRSASQRLGAFLGSLRTSLAPRARPCAFQAFVTCDTDAMLKFHEAATRVGWPLCDLVLDRTHAGASTERDYIYLVPPQAVPETRNEASLPKPARCALFQRTGATCALALEAWAKEQGIRPPALDESHREWLEREHLRFARRMVRLRDRCALKAAVLDHAEAPDHITEALANRLALVLAPGLESPRAGMEEGVGTDGTGRKDETELLAQVLAILHESSVTAAEAKASCVSRGESQGAGSTELIAAPK